MRKAIGIAMLVLLVMGVLGYFGTIMVLVSGWKLTLAWWGGIAVVALWMFTAFRLIDW